MLCAFSCTFYSNYIQIFIFVGIFHVIFRVRSMTQRVRGKCYHRLDLSFEARANRPLIPEFIGCAMCEYC